MEIKSFFVILFSSFFLVSCLQTGGISFRDSKSGEAVEVERPKDLKMPKIQLETRDSSKPFRPKWALILGPGLAKSFAHVGVLKEFARSRISVDYIVAMGWASLPAFEYVNQKSVNGFEWKVSRSEELKKLSSASFWSSALKARPLSQAQALTESLLSQKNGPEKAARFLCPLYSTKKEGMVLSDSKGLDLCMAIAPLFYSGRSYAPYWGDLSSIKTTLQNRGVEKFIYVDVMGEQVDWGKDGVRVEEPVYWQWIYAHENLKKSMKTMDKVFKVESRVSLLDFSQTLDLVKQGEEAGQDLVDFLRENYQF